MHLPECKCCGQTLPGALDFKGVHLTPQQKRLAERVQKAGKNGITREMLISFIYADDPDGGPVTAENVVQVQIGLANKRLARAGLRIQANKRGGAGAYYRIVQT